jgi:hypothetical protein
MEQFSFRNGGPILRHDRLMGNLQVSFRPVGRP